MGERRCGLWVDREVIRENPNARPNHDGVRVWVGDNKGKEQSHPPITAPATDAAKQWSGWGTALKPAHEPIVMARKPFDGTVAANVLEHGTGALNIDGCRIATFLNGGRWPANIILTHSDACVQTGTRRVKTGIAYEPEDKQRCHGPVPQTPLGRECGFADADGKETVEAWECALDCPVRQLDEQSGTSKSSGGRIGNKKGIGSYGIYGQYQGKESGDPGFGDTGAASRFFYVAKTSTSERHAGCEHLPNKNNHPTVKPIALMRYLVKLVTPPGGTVLDPFVGSGSTGCAAVIDGYDFIGIDLLQEHLDIAGLRIAHWTPEQGLFA